MNAAACAQSSEDSCYQESLSVAFIIIAKIKFSTWVIYLFDAYLQTPFKWEVAWVVRWAMPVTQLGFAGWLQYFCAIIFIILPALPFSTEI